MLRKSQVAPPHPLSQQENIPMKARLTRLGLPITMALVTSALFFALIGLATQAQPTAVSAPAPLYASSDIEWVEGEELKVSVPKGIGTSPSGATLIARRMISIPFAYGVGM